MIQRERNTETGMATSAIATITAAVTMGSTEVITTGNAITAITLIVTTLMAVGITMTIVDMTGPPTATEAIHTPTDTDTDHTAIVIDSAVPAGEGHIISHKSP